MKRTALIACLTVLTVVAHARPASAGWWAWLEEFSGPGPFKGRYAAFLFTACIDEHTLKVSPLVDEKKSPGKKFCVYADDATYRPKPTANPGFTKNNVGTQDFGVAVRMNNWLDLGAGIGRLKFQGAGGRLTLTPVRIVVRPLLLVKPINNNRVARQLVGTLSFYLKESVVGPLTGADFGTPLVPFTSGKELKTSVGFTLDLTAALGVFNKQ